MTELPPTPNGYYICYEDMDSRILPYYSKSGMVTAPFKTELAATEALLSYFQSLRDDLEGCVANTEKSLRRLQTETL